MLIGKNIILRPLKMEDLPKTNEWRNDLELIKLTQGIRFPKTLEMDEDWFNHVLRDTSNRNIYFGIDEIESGEFIGIIQLSNIDYVSGTAIWGLVIGDRKKRGKNYGFDSLSLLFDYAFNVLNLRKISGYHTIFNHAIIAIHKKFNGVFEEARLINHIFVDGKYHDVLILSLFRDDYLRNQ